MHPCCTKLANAELKAAEKDETKELLESALEHQVEARQIFQTINYTHGLHKTSLGLGKIAMHSGEWLNASELFRQSLNYATEEKNIRGEYIASLFLAKASLKTNDLATCRAALLRYDVGFLAGEITKHDIKILEQDFLETRTAFWQALNKQNHKE